MTAKKIKLIIDSNLKDVFLVELTVNKICAFIPLTDLESYQLELCVVEAVNNAIEHAYGNEQGHEVEIVINFFVDQIVFKVCDTGKAIDTKNIPEKKNCLHERGRGQEIINEVMDDVTYKTSDGKNMLTMTKSFESKGKDI